MKTVTINLALPFILGLGFYLIHKGLLTWPVFWFIVASHVNLNLTYQGSFKELFADLRNRYRLPF